MKPRKDKKLNDYFRNLEAKQSLRIQEAGRNAYKDYTSPKLEGTIFKDK